MGSKEVLQENLNSNLFSLDLEAGSTNEIVVSAVDNVGNYLVDGPRLFVQLLNG